MAKEIIRHTADTNPAGAKAVVDALIAIGVNADLARSRVTLLNSEAQNSTITFQAVTQAGKNLEIILTKVAKSAENAKGRLQVVAEAAKKKPSRSQLNLDYKTHRLLQDGEPVEQRLNKTQLDSAAQAAIPFYKELLRLTEAKLEAQRQFNIELKAKAKPLTEDEKTVLKAYRKQKRDDEREINDQTGRTKVKDKMADLAMLGKDKPAAIPQKLINDTLAETAVYERQIYRIQKAQLELRREIKAALDIELKTVDQLIRQNETLKNEETARLNQRQARLAARNATRQRQNEVLRAETVESQENANVRRGVFTPMTKSQQDAAITAQRERQKQEREINDTVKARTQLTDDELKLARRAKQQQETTRKAVNNRTGKAIVDDKIEDINIVSSQNPKTNTLTSYYELLQKVRNTEEELLKLQIAQRETRKDINRQLRDTTNKVDKKRQEAERIKDEEDKMIKREQRLEARKALKNRAGVLALDESTERQTTRNATRSNFVPLTDAQKQATIDAEIAKKRQEMEINSKVRESLGLNKAPEQRRFYDAERVANIASAWAIKAGMTTISTELSQAYESAKTLQITIAQIRTLSQDTGDSFSRWRMAINDVSDALGMDQQDVALAAYETLSNQITRTAKQTEDFLMKAGEFSRVTVSTMKDSSDLFASALNGFKIPLEDTERVAAIFFKTIDLGRVKAADLSNTFGRIAPMASALGVSIEEANAAISTLTRQGTKPSDAMTLLTNVMIKLAKPTDKMKDLLESWGTPTGQAAIATFGFEGVLKKLEETTEGSTEELSKLFNEIRSFRGAQLTTTSLFAEFKKDLDAIKASSSEYDLAKLIRAEPAADKVIKEMNRIRNAFTLQFGDQMLAAAANYISVMEAMGLTTKTFFSFLGRVGANTAIFVTLAGAVAALHGTYKVAAVALTYLTQIKIRNTAATTTNTGAIGTNTAATAQSTSQTLANTAATAANAKAKAGLLSGLGRFIPWAATAVIAFSAFREILDQTTQSMDKLTDENKRDAFLSILKTTIKPQAEVDRTIPDSYKSIGVQLLTMFANVNKQGQKELDGFRKSAEESFDSLSVIFKTYTDRMNTGIEMFRNAMNDAKSNIKQGERFITNLNTSIDKAILNFKKKHGGKEWWNDQQMPILENEIANKYKQADANKRIVLDTEKELKSIESGVLSGDPAALQRRDEILLRSKEAYEAMQNTLKEILELESERADLRAKYRLDQATAEEKSGQRFPGKFGDYRSRYRRFDDGVTRKEVLASPNDDLVPALDRLRQYSTETEKEITELRRKQIKTNNDLAESEKQKLNANKQQVDALDKLKIWDQGGEIFPKYRQRDGKVDIKKFLDDFNADVTKLRATLPKEKAKEFDAAVDLYRKAMLKTVDAAEDFDKNKAAQQRTITDLQLLENTYAGLNSKIKELDKVVYGEGGKLDKASKTAQFLQSQASLQQSTTGQKVTGFLGLAGAPDAETAAKLTAAKQAKQKQDKALELQKEWFKTLSEEIRNIRTDRDAVKVLNKIGEMSGYAVRDKISDIPLPYDMSNVPPGMNLSKPTLQAGFEALVQQVLDARKSITQQEQYKMDAQDAPQKLKEAQDTLKEQFPDLKLTTKTISETLNNTDVPLKVFKSNIDEINKQFKLQKDDLDRLQNSLKVQPEGKPMSLGGDTNFGDINVTINGGDSSQQTVREIIDGLKRELRRGTVSL